jgi:hypothetical protein
MNKFLMMLFFLFLIASASLFAQWSSSPSVNTPLAVGKSGRYDLYAISDASGNTYLTWYDAAGDTNGGVFVQKITPSGTLPWGLGGIKVDSIVQTFDKPKVALDGNGGAFVTWADSRPDNTLPNIYGQHVSSAGVAQWTVNGVCLTAGFTGELSFRQPDNPQMLSDGRNGFFFSWDDAFGLVLERVNVSGTMEWSAVADGALGATDTRIAYDGGGGVILAWTDDRNAALQDLADIYAQRIDSSGNVRWATNGVVVSNAKNLQEYPQIVADGSGGAVIAWQDFRDSTEFRGYAQKLDSSGVAKWTANGVPLSATTNAVNALFMTTDGAGGGICSWEESRGTGISGSDNIYAQRIGSNGTVQWGDSGANVCTNNFPQENPSVASDGSGGAIIAWEDNRNNGANQDIYAQRMNASGTAQWTTDGIAVSSAPNNQNLPFVVSAPNHAAVVIWDDYRTNGNGNIYPDLYAQLVTSGGGLAAVRSSIDGIPQTFALRQNFPNPFNPATQIQFTIAHAGFVSLKVYDILGKEVATLISQELSPSTYTATWNGAGVASGVYFYRLEAGSNSMTMKMVLMK